MKIRSKYLRMLGIAVFFTLLSHISQAVQLENPINQELEQGKASISKTDSNTPTQERYFGTTTDIVAVLTFVGATIAVFLRTSRNYLEKLIEKVLNEKKTKDYDLHFEKYKEETSRIKHACDLHCYDLLKSLHPLIFDEITSCLEAAYDNHSGRLDLAKYKDGRSKRRIASSELTNVYQLSSQDPKAVKDAAQQLFVTGTAAALPYLYKAFASWKAEDVKAELRSAIEKIKCNSSRP